ncbi:GntR family transcriptional regulator [Faecalicatena orotica]|uniref:GntR family transcriptional regulator n=1 Tax=Faecalicatena orotica TaxID=1544 RepID=UPI0032170909
METLDNGTSIPLYDQLAERIRNDIYEGKFNRGEKIPSELELSDMYSISRSTVRKALSVLVSEKLLVKAHGKGTFVASPKMNQHSSTFLSFTDNVKSMGKTLTTKTISRTHIEPTRSQMAFFGLKAGEMVLEIKRLRIVDKIAICVETTWFSSQYDSLMGANLNGSLYAVLKSEYNIKPLAGSKTIELCYASEEESKLLDVPRGSSLMLVEDLVYDNNENPLHITKQVVRGDKFKYALK